MKELDQLVELDIYFKYYEMFNKYMSTVKSQYESLKDIEDKINELEDSMSGEDVILAQKFEAVISEIDKEKEVLSEKFCNYDFSSETVKENHNDYKILCYKFAKDTMNKYLESYLKDSGDFESEEEFLYFLDNLEVILLDFFSKNFKHTSGIISIFDKARMDIINARKCKS